jgi:CRP/FNR family transcriptional regulator, anaerobic regulatory protein
MPIENVLSALQKIIPFSMELQEALLSTLKSKTFKKKDYLLTEGKVCNHIYFIESGMVRSFYLKDGKEICSWFMKEGDVIISVRSFFSRTPSNEYLQALENTMVHYVHYNELNEIYQRFPEFNIVGRILTEKYYQLSEERLYSMRKQSASERFEFLLKYHPEISQRVPRGHIASYLGVTLETLSRIHKKKI